MGRISTDKLQMIKDRAEEFVDNASTLLDLRDDPEADPEEKQEYNDLVEEGLANLKDALGIK